VNHEYWYLSRAAGFTAYLLLFASVALGIAIGTRLADRIAKRNAIFDLHRFTTILALAFALFHVYVLLGDSFFNFNVWQLSLPFISPYRTWQTAVGVFALYALGLLILSFYVRKFIGYRTWRAVHFTTFVMFAGVALHGIAAGTDTGQVWARLIYITTGAATLGLVIYRVQYRIPDTSTMRAVRLGAGISAVGVTAAVLFATGLLATGSDAATTQTAVVVAGGAAQPAVAANGGAGQPAAVAQGTAPQHPFLASFDNDFSGRYTQTRDQSGSRLVIDGTTAGDLPSVLHVELVQTTVIPTPDDETIEPVPDDEVVEARPTTTITTNKAELSDTGVGTVFCAGQLTSLDEGYLQATCDGSGPYQGVRISLASRVQPSADGSLTGALSGKMQRLS
jgi:hypothetical protein